MLSVKTFHYPGTWLPVIQSHFPDGSLHLEPPKLSHTFVSAIRWNYENDAELFSLICLKNHYCNDNISLYMPYCPHVRMTVLYAIAALEHGRVANTCNKSEDFIGYSTKFGDSAGDFSLLSNLTVKEVLAIGRELGLPEEFISKAPEDGLSGKTDEDNLGFTYKELDDFLVFGNVPDYDTFANIMERHQRNLHKVEPMPKYGNLVGLFRGKHRF